MRLKYPRTSHVSWSPGASDDDIVLDSQEHFVGRTVVLTEKLDGENSSFYRDGLHARSLDSRHHESRNWVKGLHGGIKHLIPEGWRLCGENLFAVHSIFYNELPSYFFLFGVYDDKNQCLSWEETEYIASELGLCLPPVLYQGLFDEAIVRGCYTSISIVSNQTDYDQRLEERISGGNVSIGVQEGYVLRVVDAFPYNDFSHNVAKMVRVGHVTTDTHWMSQEVIPNWLKK